MKRFNTELYTLRDFSKIKWLLTHVNNFAYTKLVTLSLCSTLLKNEGRMKIERSNLTYYQLKIIHLNLCYRAASRRSVTRGNSVEPPPASNGQPITVPVPQSIPLPVLKVIR